MGAWGAGAFDNDTACDWSNDLVDRDDLSFVQETLYSAEDAEDDELDADLASAALAACEVVARLQGRTSRSSSDDVVDQWVKQHALKPSPGLVKLATNVLDRVVSNGSELAQLWRGDQAWTAAVQDLRKRVAG